jgi:hypothetical protein
MREEGQAWLQRLRHEEHDTFKESRKNIKEQTNEPRKEGKQKGTDEKYNDHQSERRRK